MVVMARVLTVGLMSMAGVWFHLHPKSSWQGSNLDHLLELEATTVWGCQLVTFAKLPCSYELEWWVVLGCSLKLEKMPVWFGKIVPTAITS